MKQTCLVVGGGLSGLFCAGFLARAGYKVELFEAAPKLAPVVRGFWRQDWYFDTGFHYTGGLKEGEILHRIFTFLGLAEGLHPITLNPAGFDRVCFDNEEDDFLFPSSFEALEQSLSARFPTESVGIRAFLQHIRRVVETLPMLQLDPQAPLSPEINRAREQSLYSTLIEYVQDPRLIRLLSLHCLLHGVAPDKVPFAVHAGVAGLYYQGAHTISGGGEQIVRVFEETLRTLDVKMHCNSRVKAIRLKSDGRFAGLKLHDDREVEGDRCIVTVHPRVAVDLVPAGGLRPIYRRRLKNLEDTGTACCLFGSPRGPLPQLQGQNLFLDFSSIPFQGPIYLTRAAGERHSGIVAICPEPDPKWEPPNYQGRKAHRLHQIREAIYQHSPALAESIDWLDGATPRTFRHYANTPVGGIYGAAHCVGQRNPQPRTKIQGLYLAGQAVVAPGLLGTALSAFWACQELCGNFRLKEGLMRCL